MDEILHYTMHLLSAFVLVHMFLLSRTFSQTINDTETLHSELFKGYNRNIRPIYDQSKAIDVNVTMYIKSIQEFDEVKEEFSYVAALEANWNDVRMKWDPGKYGGLTEITVSRDDVWIPELILSSPSNKRKNMDASTDRIRFSNNGRAEWKPGGLIESTCSVNSRNYPFDTQTCTTTYTSLGYKNYEVNLKADMPTVQFDVYSPNALWDVVGSEAKSVTLGSGGESDLSFTIKIKRKASFVIIHVLLPILMFGLLNGFVFLLVPESGERTGYCITTLVAIAVYMTIVSGMLPQTSEPMPIISYKLLIDMMESACIVVVTILNRRLSNKDDYKPVPHCLQAVYRFLSCSRCRKVTVHTEKTSVISVKSVSLTNIEISSKSKNKQMKSQRHVKGLCDDQEDPITDPITWKKISFMVDIFAFVAFTLMSFLSFTIFIVLTNLRE